MNFKSSNLIFLSNIQILGFILKYLISLFSKSEVTQFDYLNVDFSNLILFPILFFVILKISYSLCFSNLK